MVYGDFKLAVLDMSVPYIAVPKAIAEFIVASFNEIEG